MNNNYKKLHRIIDRIATQEQIPFNQALFYCCFFCLPYILIGFLAQTKRPMTRKGTGLFNSCEQPKLKQPQETLKLIQDFLVEYARCLTEEGPYTNILQDILNHDELNKKGLGQCFTPDGISDALAGINHMDAGKYKEPIYRIAEICGGIGGMTLSTLRDLYKTDKQLLHRTELYFNELKFDLSIIALFQIEMSCIGFHDAYLLKITMHAGDIITEYKKEPEHGLTVIYNPAYYQYLATQRKLDEIFK